MDLLESVRRWVLGFLPYDRGDAKLVVHINGLSARELLIVYHNWMSRLIEVRPRRVHVSATLDGQIDGSPHAPVLRRIMADIAAGENLVRFLSRSVAIAAQIPRTGEHFNR